MKAIYIDKTEADYTCQLAEITLEQPEKVLLQVEYSGINYKDALAVTGKSPVVRNFPMVPGIDCAGKVIASQDPRFVAGEQVLLTGFGVGEKYWGGLAEQASFNPDFLVKMPEGLTSFTAMAVGTAGFTAMLCVQALIKHGITADKGKVLVTGATGGVGSYALIFLAKLGYQVVAVTGKAEQVEHLKALGASEVLLRSELEQAGKPLMKERWAGAIDCLGGQVLANILASTAYGGAVACCGLAASMDLPATVAPFILRGVSLLGIDSVMYPIELRQDIWQQIAELISEEEVKSFTQVITLEEVIPSCQKLIQGKVTGRLVVKL
ncbi:alcohol dehydrogenase [Psittacicella hinzii]|uniref:Alcohol dehydrogenase n=1 Tax=Psittacicella hinzii TaxID=2028575 RepID=A0A3A1Y1I9_9GAMM|nr:MDR family oxidoreductase [Psittacicella hinzii]RIY31159.1 alcohol dehydrogenase [Psittacicella hinzii]